MNCVLVILYFFPEICVSFSVFFPYFCFLFSLLQIHSCSIFDSSESWLFSCKSGSCLALFLKQELLGCCTYLNCWLFGTARWSPLLMFNSTAEHQSTSRALGHYSCTRNNILKVLLVSHLPLIRQHSHQPFTLRLVKFFPMYILRCDLHLVCQILLLWAQQVKCSYLFPGTSVIRETGTSTGICHYFACCLSLT